MLMMLDHKQTQVLQQIHQFQYKNFFQMNLGCTKTENGSETSTKEDEILYVELTKFI